MQEGYSTATLEMREMGFGAGMGLPNIKKNSDEFDVSSEVGRGTRLFIRVKPTTNLNDRRVNFDHIDVLSTMSQSTCRISPRRRCPGRGR